MALTDTQIQGAILYAAGIPTAEIAKKCKVSQVEVVRWMDEGEFIGQVDKIVETDNRQRENKALASLGEMMDSTSANERAAATRTFLNYWKTAKKQVEDSTLSVTFRGMATPKSGMEGTGGGDT